jgi:hypothetical protein
MTVSLEDLPALEVALEKLIREHGIDKLNQVLPQLIGTHLNWPDWQRVANLAARINGRINREEPTRPQIGKKK